MLINLGLVSTAPRPQIAILKVAKEQVEERI
jgi:hypothetical protein